MRNVTAHLRWKSKSVIYFRTDRIALSDSVSARIPILYSYRDGCRNPIRQRSEADRYTHATSPRSKSNRIVIEFMGRSSSLPKRKCLALVSRSRLRSISLTAQVFFRISCRAQSPFFLSPLPSVRFGSILSGKSHERQLCIHRPHSVSSPRFSCRHQSPFEDGRAEKARQR